MKWEVPFDWPIRDALNRVTSVGVSIYVNEKSEANAHIRETIHMARLPRMAIQPPSGYRSLDGPNVLCWTKKLATRKPLPVLMLC